jgi:hypothetical protein
VLYFNEKLSKIIVGCKLMGRKLKKLIIIGIGAVMLLTSGCSVPFINNFESATSSNATSTTAINIKTVPKADDDKVMGLIKDYFVKLYSMPVYGCMQDSEKGNIPSIIKNFISQETIELADGNTENGINLPRYVNINDMVTISYAFINKKDTSGKASQDIEANFAGYNSDIMLYYVKLNLKAKCITSSTLYAIQNEITQKNPKDENEANDMLIQKLSTINSDDSQTDFIKIQASYDIEVKKEGDNFKIVTAKEANRKPGLDARMLIYNNDFITRLPYLSILNNEESKNEDSDTDIKTYNSESALIKAFFDNIRINFDNEKMKLLNTNWSKNINSFKDYLRKVGDPIDKNSKALLDLMDIGNDYMQKFDLESFPLMYDMDRITGAYTNFVITQHPSYSPKQKRYMVKFKAPIKKINGFIEGFDTIYNYDYYVTLSGKDNTLKINEIKLNQYFQ